jgi:hypothetical protein
MRRSFVIAMALALALAVSGLALAARGDNGKGKRHVQTIELTASGFADRDLDLDPPDLSLGDYFVVTEDLFRKGEKVGHDHATCAITRLEPRTGTPETGAVQCLATLVLPEGQITVQGVRTFALDAQEPPNFVVAVTGGTGAYKAARGSVHIVDINETDSRLTLELVR